MNETKQINKIECPICKKRFYNVLVSHHYCDLCGSSFNIDEHHQINTLIKNYQYIIFNEILEWTTISTGVGWYIIAAFYKDQYKLPEKILFNLFLIFSFICLILSGIRASRHGIIGTRSIVEPMVYREEKPCLFLAWIFMHIVIGITVLYLFIVQFDSS